MKRSHPSRFAGSDLYVLKQWAGPCFLFDFNMQRRGDTVLVVDDQDAILRLAEKALTAFGFKVLTAGSGQQGFITFQQHEHEIGVVVADIVMPVLSGPEMVQRILHQRPNTAIIYMTSYADDELPPMPEHRFAVLHKPFTPAELAQSVRQVLSSGQGAAPASGS